MTTTYHVVLRTERWGDAATRQYLDVGGGEAFTSRREAERYARWYRSEYLPGAIGSAARGYTLAACDCPEPLDDPCPDCGRGRDVLTLLVMEGEDIARFAQQFVA